MYKVFHVNTKNTELLGFLRLVNFRQQKKSKVILNYEIQDSFSLFLSFSAHFYDTDYGCNGTHPVDDCISVILPFMTLSNHIRASIVCQSKTFMHSSQLNLNNAPQHDPRDFSLV